MNDDLKVVVYVKQPEGYKKKGKEDRLYVLHKALYGIRQAPRAWNVKLDQVLEEKRFKKCMKDPPVYRKNEGEDLLLISIYFDDLFVTGTSLKVIKKFEEEVSKKFEILDIGKLAYYLGV